jgi:hypothetical protein
MVTAVDEPHMGYHSISHHKLGDIYHPTNQPITAALRQAQALDVLEFYDDTTIGSTSRRSLARFLDLPEAVDHARQDFCNACETRHVMASITANSCAEEHTSELTPAFRAMNQTAQSRAFVITDSGHIGFAPVSTKVGDQIYLLLGSHVPFVLRPCGQKFKFYWCLLHPWDHVWRRPPP